jgi:hypothetical protein
MRWQVRHSKVRISKPRLPVEIWANPILCLQAWHDGRPAMKDVICVTLPPLRRVGSLGNTRPTIIGKRRGNLIVRNFRCVLASFYDSCRSDHTEGALAVGYLSAEIGVFRRAESLAENGRLCGKRVHPR